MRYPELSLPVMVASRVPVRGMAPIDLEAATPYYERPWQLRAAVHVDPAECDCLESCQSELLLLLQTLES